jgi:hypothetical protein
VRDAASDAGIAPEFIDLALMEGAEAEPARLSGGRLAKWLAGRAPRSVVVSRRFAHPVAVVQAAVLRVFPKYHLMLLDSRPIAANGGEAMTFALSVAQSDGAVFRLDADLSAVHFMRDLYRRSSVQEVHLRLEQHGEGTSLAVLSAALGKDPGRRLLAGVTMTVGGGVLGGWGLGAAAAFATIGLGVGGLAAGAAIGTAIALGLGAGGAAGVRVTRSESQSAQRAAEVALERLLQLVGAELRPALGAPLRT